MRKRRSYNPKRRLCSESDIQSRQGSIKVLVQKLRYNGNPEHKRHPGDFNLDPPSAHRPGKTLCDQVKIFTRNEALTLLRAGLERGLFSVQEREGWPQNIWAVTNQGDPLEAQLEQDGIYHGYPMAQDDPFRIVVLRRWTASS